MDTIDNTYTDENGVILHEHHRFQVDPKQTPIRIDRYIFGKLEKVTRTRIQRAIKSNAVLVNGKYIKSNYKVRPNDLILIVLPEEPREKKYAEPENIPLDIRYEDEHLMVIYKPAGMVVHPGSGNYTGTLVNGLAYYLKSSNVLPTLPGNDLSRPGLVHRIDKDTTGLMVIAKTHSAMTHLAQQFFDHKIQREYLALVWGNFDEKSGRIEGHIGRDIRTRIKMSVYPDGDIGKPAATQYEVLEDLYYVTLVKCVLETGRTHQIRVHMAYKKHPLFNDEKYGGASIVKGTVFSKYKQFVQNVFEICPRQALHAHSIGFIHPETEEFMRFETDLPEDMQTALDKWRHYVTHKKSRV